LTGGVEFKRSHNGTQIRNNNDLTPVLYNAEFTATAGPHSVLHNAQSTATVTATTAVVG